MYWKLFHALFMVQLMNFDLCRRHNGFCPLLSFTSGRSNHGRSSHHDEMSAAFEARADAFERGQAAYARAIAASKVPYDVLDVEVKQFDDDFYEFRCSIKELERRLGSKYKALDKALASRRRELCVLLGQSEAELDAMTELVKVDEAKVADEEDLTPI